MTRRWHSRLLCAWLYVVPLSLAFAAESSLAHAVRGYDWEFLIWAVLVALLGGFGRTVRTLLSLDEVVLGVFRECFKDLLVAALAGLVVAVILLAIQPYLDKPIPSPALVLALAASGWSRMAVIVWAEKTVSTLSHHFTQWAANKVSKPDPSQGYDGAGPHANHPEDETS